MSMNFDRRDFMRFVTGGAIATAASGVSREGISWFNAALGPEQTRVPGGPESWALAVCTQCEAGCGLRVRRIGDRAVKVQGNPLDPVNHGGLCPKGPAALQELYHPDRLRSPLRNTGTRQAPQWKTISWDEAIALVTRELRELRDAGQADQVAVIDAHERGLTGRLLREFLAAYGSSRYLVLPSGLDSMQAALRYQQGVTRPVAFDWDNTRYLLNFGASFLEGWGSPATIMRAFGRWRDSAAGRRTKFVQVEPRLSVSAARADEWIALKPGTEAALALGIAYVLITEELYDAAFVAAHTFGFEDWHDAQGRAHMGFRSLVTSDYRLDDVAERTGVPAEIILRVAREFGRNRPAVALGDHQTSTLPGDPYAAMAVHSLNALVGSLDVPGGVLLQAELPGSEAVPERLGNLSAKAVLIHEANPVFSMPNGDAVRRALAATPFVAAFTSFLDETSALADVILPSPTGLEKWQGMTSPPTFPGAMVSIGAPVVAPRHRTRHPADVMLNIARGLRGPVAAALPYANFEEYLKKQVEGLHAAQTGSLFTSGMEEAWNRLLERSGWWAPTWSKADELWEQMKQYGGWWEPAYPFGEWSRVFRTRSGKFEFYSQKLAERFDDDRLCLPHQPARDKAPSDRPLELVPVEVLPLAGGTGGRLPYLQQIAGVHLGSAWESWLEIHPETAKRLGIGDGEMVWVESRRGRVRARARHYAGAHPDAVYLPLGYGHTEGGEWGREGANPLALVEERYDPVAGLPQAWGTHVKVYRS